MNTALKRTGLVLVALVGAHDDGSHDRSVALLGGLDPDQPGLDLRGCFIGSEGTMGIATRIAVRLTPNPPVVRTLLLDFTSIEDAAATVSGIIAVGIVPAALEMMDAERGQHFEPALLDALHASLSEIEELRSEFAD